MYTLQYGRVGEAQPKKLNEMSTNNLKSHFSELKNNNKFSCHTVPIDKMCNLESNIESPEVENFQCNIEICEDDQLYPPLTLDLYSLPAHEVSVFNTCVNQIPAPCHVSGSEKNDQNKLLMQQKFSYPRIDPEASGIVYTRTDDQKMASILRICSQILSKGELQCWNELAERFLENATRYESGIPKIRSDMLQEIKHYRISEKARK